MTSTEKGLVASVAQSVSRDIGFDSAKIGNRTPLNTNNTGMNPDLFKGNETVHLHNSTELDADDSEGSQGGQKWRPPTITTTPAPTTSALTTLPTAIPIFSPMDLPTYHPTLHGDPFVLRGTIWYDRNANGERDSNVKVDGLGRDVEYTYGLGGVSVQLVECDPYTNERLAAEDSREEEGDNSYASTISQGYDVLMHPMLVRDGGK